MKFEKMAVWGKARLSDLAEFFAGGTPRTSENSYWNGTIPWISVKDFNAEGRYIYDTEKHISMEGLQHSTAKLLQKDDIIISARGTVGELAMASRPMAFNQSCYGIRPKRGVDKVFFYYLLKNNVDQMKKVAHGSVLSAITRESFSNIEVLLPDLTAQKQIGTILAAIDDKIYLNRKINDNLI